MRLFLSQKNKNSSQRGFTLVESLVAISILLVAIAGPLTLVVKALQLSNYATTRVAAGFLAQDALEYIRNIKDTNALAGNLWLSGIPSQCFYPTFCAIDTTQAISGAFVLCPSNVCPPLHQNGTTFSYNQVLSDTETIFTRSVQFKDAYNSGSDDKFVFVTISWQVSGVSKSMTVQTSLRDWHY